MARKNNKNNKNKQKKHAFHDSFFQSLFYVTISVVVAIILARLPAFHAVMSALGSFGYIGAFVGGMLFVSVFTAAPGAALLVALNESLPELPLAVVAGLGGMIGDFIIMSVITHEAREGGKILPKKSGILRIIRRLRQSKYRMVLTILGSLIVASPLPDEFGLSLMGLSKVRGGWFLILTFLLDFIGIYIMLLFL